MLDALISLPILSFFALPLVSSYSTSLNLLFFYMTWSTLILSHTPLKVEIFGTLFIRLVFYVLPSLLFLALDCLLPSLMESIKAQGDIALPLQYGRRRLTKVVGLAVGNVILGVAAQVGIGLACKSLGVREPLKIATALPMPWGIAKDLLYAFVVRNVAAYYIHLYILHRSRTVFSSLHASYHHSIRAPFSFTATYDHPIPYLLGHFLPNFLPALLFQPHILTYHLFLALVSLEDLFTYSGYNVLPSNIILAGMARRTDAHMMSRGAGNFAPWGVLDWVHGTGVGKGVMQDLKEEAEKNDVQGKAGRAIEGAGGFLDDAGERIKKRGRGKK